MKNLIILALLTGFILIGCQDDNSVLDPSNSSNVEVLGKLPQLEGDENEASQIYLNVLPKIKYSKNYTIDGNVGGKIKEKHQWNYSTGTLKLEADLTIPSGAFEGDLTFDIVFNPNLLSMELHPTPFEFNVPVILNLKFKGISEVYDIDPDNLDFQYYNPDGTFEFVKYDAIEWDPILRELKVKKAELHHFSRYGWTRNR